MSFTALDSGDPLGPGLVDKAGYSEQAIKVALQCKFLDLFEIGLLVDVGLFSYRYSGQID